MGNFKLIKCCWDVQILKIPGFNKIKSRVNERCFDWRDVERITIHFLKSSHFSIVIVLQGLGYVSMSKLYFLLFSSFFLKVLVTLVLTCSILLTQ